MCIIIIKDNKDIIQDEILLKSAHLNPHGLGITWLDTWKTEYSLSSDWAQLQTDRPFIAHFRYATVGKVCMDNNHPFRIGDTQQMLYQNGSVLNLGDKDRVDAQHMADILADSNPEHWESILEMSDCRWVIIDPESSSYELYNEEMFIEKDNVTYSKKNVLEGELVAVYGTLKRGFGNNSVMGFASKFVSTGETYNKYPMICSGIPFVYPNKGEGHNIKVEVFLTDTRTLEGPIDGLEGHPHNYRREKTLIKLEDGNYVHCWLYFYPHYHSGLDSSQFEAEFTRGYDPNYSNQLSLSTKWGSSWGQDLDATYWGDTRLDDIEDNEKAKASLDDVSGSCCDKCGNFDTRWDDVEDELWCHDCATYTSSIDIVWFNAAGDEITKEQSKLDHEATNRIIAPF